jgi:ATP-dependent Zn protease
MTFAPAQNRASGSSRTTRTIIFWIMMMALAVFLWRWASNSPTASKPMSYSDFAAQVDKSNVAAARLLEGRSTTQIEGQLRQPAQSFTATIPNEVIPDLLQKLQKQGTAVDVKEAPGANPASGTSLLMNLAPLLVILFLAIFIFRMRRRRQTPAQQGTPSSGPLG